MTPVRKFLFDTEFDPFELPPLPKAKASGDSDGEEHAKLDELQAEEAPPEEEAPATFTQDDLTAARAAGFEEGRQKAATEAREATETRTSDILKRIAEALEAIMDTQAATAEATERDAIQIASSIATKMFPHLNRKHGLDEVSAVVMDVLKGLREEPKVTVRVSAPFRDAVVAAADSIINRGDFEGKISVVADDSLPEGDCRLEWGSGSAERDMRQILAGIDDIIEQNLFAGDKTAATEHEGPEQHSEPQPAAAETDIKAEDQPDGGAAFSAPSDDQAG
ncbi:MAG: FliH/SctL family protein [Rhodospirillales bacterium]|nr:FliH/SctL family protein [Rhodospirillales bacterium]MCW8951958.1 FliH/SctL family protein [Rhodospirillales bacterium]